MPTLTPPVEDPASPLLDYDRLEMLDGAPPIDGRIRIRKLDPADPLIFVGSGVSSFALVYLLLEQWLPLSGALGFLLVWFAFFVVMVGFISAEVYDPVRARDKVATVVVWAGGLAVFIPLVLILTYTIGRGYHLLRPSFFTQTMETASSLEGADEGGALHAIIGTLQQVGIAMLISVPLGILSALYLNEVRGRFAGPLRTLVDAMSAIPSILAGLFIYATWVVALGRDFSGFAGSLALSILFIPTVTRTAEVVLRLVPGGLREAALALGGTDYRVAGQVVLPTARSGLMTAVILGTARVIGETAPLILTVFGANAVNGNPFSEPQSSLPMFVFGLRGFPEAIQVQRAWTGALTLMILVLVLFVIARIIGGRAPGAKPPAERYLVGHDRLDR